MKSVVFVDVQNDFIDGALRNEKAIEVAPKIVEFAKGIVENDPDNQYKFYATMDTHKKTKYGFYETKSEYPVDGYLASLEGQKLPVEHCIEGTPGWEINESLMNVLEGDCTFIPKPTFGSFDLAKIIEEDFFETTKEDTYTKANIDVKPKQQLEEIILCGFCTDICVAANAVILRAKFPNTKITVMKDLCAGVTEESHNAALKVLEMQQIEVV